MSRLALRLTMAAAIASTAVLAPADAQNTVTLTVAGVLDYCTRADPHWVDFCNGYFQAVVDAYEGIGEFCIPPGTTRTTIVTAGMALLQATVTERQELARENGAAGVASILAILWSCR